MAKLNFIIGTMGSSKTALALIRRYDAMSNGKKVLIIKSSLDTRDGKNILCSRSGLKAPVDEFSPDDNILLLYKNKLKDTNLVIADEVELMTGKQAEQLRSVATDYNIDVYAYGLRTNFMTKAFEGSKRMFELADSITMLENLCPCGELAIFNSRYDADTGNILYEGPEIEIGGNERYIGLCYKCYHNGNVKDKIEALERNYRHLKLAHINLNKAKKDLYIDFDGVVLDTIPTIYNLFEKNGIDNKNVARTYEFLVDADWEAIINDTAEINESINNIKKIIDSNMYNVRILTHVNSNKEALLKERYLQEQIPGINVISVNKKKSKTDIVNSEGAILIDDYSKNLKEWTDRGGISVKFSREKEEDSPFKVIDRLDEILEIEL